MKGVKTYRVKKNVCEVPIFDRQEMEGKVAYLCPHCFNYGILDVSIKSLLTHANSKDNTWITMHHGIRCICAKCNKYFEQDPIDASIVSILAVLNSKGYTTVYSCEGHNDVITTTVDGDVKTAIQAYITFKDGAVLNTLIDKYPLPENWHIDHDDLDWEDENTTLTIRSEDKSKTNRLWFLMNWAENIPELSKVIY